MAQTSWPFENIDTSETQFSQWARNIGEGVKGSVTGTELKVYGDNSGLSVKVPTGQAMVRGHYYFNTAIETLTVTTANATNPRIDTVVLELDPTLNSILLKVIAGTPAASPVAPTLTQTDSGVYQYPLADVAVPALAGAISAANVTDRRTFLGAKSSAEISTAMSDKSSAYTIQASDRNSYIRATSAITVTVADVLAKGDSINFIQAGSGQITFRAAAGVTLLSADNNLKTLKQYAAATVVSAGSGTYYLVGNLGA